MTELSAEQWRLLKMLPPSENHDPFHEYVNADGKLSAKGMAVIKFAGQIIHRCNEIQTGKATRE